MINIYFIKNKKNNILKFIINGHAENNKFYNNKLCAIVSVLTISTINNAYFLTKLKSIKKFLKLKNGYIKFEFKICNNKKKNLIIQILLINLLLTFKELKKKYSKFIFLKEILK